MEATILIIAVLVFILGYRYINYLKEYMYIRFGIDVLKRKNMGLWKRVLIASCFILIFQLYITVLLGYKMGKLINMIIEKVCNGSK